MADVVVSILAHPDDAEFLCAGTLTRLVRERGWRAHIATMTPGDCGSAELPPEEISRVRRGEGAAAAAVIGAQYHCVEERDLLVFYQERTLERVTRLRRAVRPAVVLTHSPGDVLTDAPADSVRAHGVPAAGARAAASPPPTPTSLRARALAPPLDHIPHLYYCDPIEGKDALGRVVEPAFCVDVSGVIDV